MEAMTFVILGMLTAADVSVPERFEMPFNAQDEAAARQWQEAVRTRLLAMVEAQNPRTGRSLDVEIGAFTAKDGFKQADLRFTSNEGRRVEATLTLPDGEGPFPGLACLHGHSGNREMMHDPSSNYGGLALGYAQRGFVTLTPSLWHCDYAANQLWNLMRLLDILEAMDAVDPARLGVAGLSMGGEWSMWLAACDPRIKAAVVSGWMCTTEGVLRVPNCPCWRIPGLLELCDVAEVHILIAPRPVLFESAKADNCFPIDATRDGYRKIVQGYNAFGVPMNARQHVFPGGHAWSGAVAYGFMKGALESAQ